MKKETKEIRKEWKKEKGTKERKKDEGKKGRRKERIWRERKKERKPMGWQELERTGAEIQRIW